MSTRPYTEYADLKYLDLLGPAHVVPFGDERALCGVTANCDQWFGTGDWNEIEYAAWLSLCTDCGLEIYPYLKPVVDPDPAVDMWREATTYNPPRSTS